MCKKWQVRNRGKYFCIIVFFKSFISEEDNMDYESEFQMIFMIMLLILPLVSKLDFLFDLLAQFTNFFG